MCGLIESEVENGVSQLVVLEIYCVSECACVA